MPVVMDTRRGGATFSARTADWFDLEDESALEPEHGWESPRSLAHAFEVFAHPPDLSAFVWVPRRTDGQVAERLANLREWWTSETEYLSSVSKKVFHPAYQQIIGLGPQAVPLLIDFLREDPDHWFWALASIVGEDHATGTTTPTAAARRWIDWYDEQR